MRLVRHLSNACDRAREWSSLALDGELSGFEQALLDAHLERCEDCRAFTAGVGDTTALLRDSMPERPSRPIAIPGRARPRTTGVRNVLALAAAASIFVTAGLFGVMHSLGTDSQPLLRQRAVHQPLQANADLLQQKRARRAQLVAVIKLRTAGPGGPQLPGFVTS
jgi:predicted anti-sigma-YlaC factor YlaD